MREYTQIWLQSRFASISLDKPTTSIMKFKFDELKLKFEKSEY